ncbi:hypothetical protein BDZ97DRAFT_1832018 [Flammula alnicola]|nr:hypothetical protein BDZ97DRAFT_1832018 [Flammula alnicola]
MRVESLRIVESDPEASLHPRDIWNYWKKNVIWDPRTYYGLLESIGVLVCLFSFVELQQVSFRFWADDSPTLQLFTGVLLLLAISPLHWYSNHRHSSHFLTRSRSHLAVLLILALTIFVLKLQISSSYTCQAGCEMMVSVNIFLWVSIFILIFTAYLIYSLARNPRKDPILAELPSPIDVEDDQGRLPWTEATVADGIEDDSLEPEGQVRLS